MASVGASLARGVMNPVNAALHIVITFLVSFPIAFWIDAAFCVGLIYLEASLGEESPRNEATPRDSDDTLPARCSDRWLRGPKM